MASKNRTAKIPFDDQVAAKVEHKREQHRAANRLNDLDSREWLLATKSVWYKTAKDLESPHLQPITDAVRAQFGDTKAAELLSQVVDSLLVSRPGARDSLKALHPATFAESDIIRLINFFTKSGDWVLDPFLGSGTTLVACKQTNRNGVGIELTRKWAAISRERTEQQPGFFDSDSTTLKVIQGDARTELRKLKPNQFGFIVTSPPYWSMLNKKADHKVKRERVQKGLPTNYSKNATDLGNLGSYQEFMDALCGIFSDCFPLLQAGRYIAVIVSDFRDKSRFHLFHADIASVLERVGFQLAGLTVLVQDSKTLYPYGMPYAFVSNIHHQFVVIARKP